MDNPIIVLIIWGVVNLLIKSSKDKKRAQEAQRRKSNQGDMQRTPPISTSKSKPNQHKSIIDVFKEEIEKEIKKEKGLDNRNTKPPVQERKPTVPKKEESRTLVDYTIIGDNEQLEIVKVASISNETHRKKQSLNLKKDLYKGIIYSEILSEPKGLKYLRK